MLDVRLYDLVEEWLDNRWGLIISPGSYITGACECGTRARYATIYSDGVALSRATCECVDCKRTTISSADPQFFDLLSTGLQARVAHKSVLVSNHLKDGDDIQHAVDHFQDGKVIFLTGTFTGQSVDLKNGTLSIKNGTISDCEFKNINNPIETTGNVNINGCTFVMGGNSPFINAPYI